MNLKFEWNGIKLEIQNGDLASVERTILSAFALIEGGSFVDTFKNTEIERRPVNSKKTFTPAENGVRVINGQTLYKCSYNCGCREKGIRYIKEDAETTNCHKCNAELKVEPSTLNEAHDEEFNYFVAY